MPVDGSVHRLGTLDIIMDLIMKISHIDHNVEEYVVACAYRPLQGLPDGGKTVQIQKHRDLPPAARLRMSKEYTKAFKGDPDLRLARRVRNDMAHNIDTIAGNGASGAYYPATRYSLKDLKAACNAADRYTQRTQKHFMANPRYRKWQAGRPATDVYPPPGR